MGVEEGVVPKVSFVEAQPTETDIRQNNQSDTLPKKKAPRRARPNYNKIHSKPLPVDTWPLPAFHPAHPLSLFRLAYAYMSQLLAPPTSHAHSPYLGKFSHDTRSVHVTDPEHIRALWEMGFFGKGLLSRSEPSWMERERERFRAECYGDRFATAEQATQARREQRRLFKLERARLEKEKIERQRAIESGALRPGDGPRDGPDDGTSEVTTNIGALDEVGAVIESIRAPDAVLPSHVPIGPEQIPEPRDEPSSDPAIELDIENQEHLQLTLEEAFFLHYALGVLRIECRSRETALRVDSTATTAELLSMFSQCARFPPAIDNDKIISPDNRFMLNYVVYHHFRSLGWVVRPGAKFSADYLLYNRGPVFSHAEFAVLIVPAYTNPYWRSGQGMAERAHDSKDWWWLHCANRVQSQVKKTLVLVYVDIPPPSYETAPDHNIGQTLRRYKIREFVLRRWLANRSRD